MGNHWRYKCLRHVVKRRPQERNVKRAPCKVQGLLEKAADIPNWIVVLILTGLPASRARIMNQVG
jgi:hypothetical protein